MSAPDVLALLVAAIWLGLFTGLVEALGLLLFQHLNWRNWGQMLHVSLPILWISPIVDVGFFTLVFFIALVLKSVVPRLPVVSALGFILSFLAAYDWLTLIARLYRISCILLALGAAFAFARWARRNERRLRSFFLRTAWVLVTVWFILFVAIHWGSRWKESNAVAHLPSAKKGAPNVLIVVIDTLRGDHLSAYGYPRLTSPNIDRIAKAGVLFENAISPAPWSLPAHVSLLTGRYQFEHGVSDIPAMSLLGRYAPPLNGFTTLGDVLQRHGYRTGAFSANLVNFSANLGFSAGFLHFEDYFQSSADAFVRTLYGREFARLYLNRSEHSKVKRLLRWIGWSAILDRSDEGSIRVIGALGVEKRAATINRELFQWIDSGGPRPFMAFLNYIDVHHPYGGPADFQKPWPAARAIDQYDDGIRYVDECVGSLVDELRRRGLADHTILVITSDHGESLGDHQIAFHGESLYREQVHVPLIFWAPGRIPAGIRVPDLISSASLPGTVISVLGLPPEAEFKLPAVNSRWENPRPDSRPEVLSEVAQLYPASDEDVASEKVVPVSMLGSMRSLTSTRWKLIEHEKLGSQLYDIGNDALETQDRFRAPQSQQEGGELAMMVQSTVAGTPSGPAGELAIGTFPVPRGRLAEYTMHAAPGHYFSFEVKSANVRAPFQPVLSISGRDGAPIHTCRNPSDDHIPPPGSPDPTPDAFDDVCMNSMSQNGGSRLDIFVPGQLTTPVELFIRISDWAGRPIPDGCEIAVGEAAPL
jgi:arylsulfatase A-like enzyme